MSSIQIHPIRNYFIKCPSKSPINSNENKIHLQNLKYKFNAATINKDQKANSKLYTNTMDSKYPTHIQVYTVQQR